MHRNSNIFHWDVKADKLVEIALISYFIFGVCISFVYETLDMALGVGLTVLTVYYSTKFLFPNKETHRYIASSGFAIFMAQFIYQMHGLFEMHFFAFIGSTIIIAYQNWRTVLPIALIITIHHTVFAYIQMSGFEEIYFSQIDWDMTTLLFHLGLAVAIFGICGLWSFVFEKNAKAILLQLSEIESFSYEVSLKNELLQKSNKALDSFVYSASHDLKSPVVDMKTMLKMLEKSAKDDPKVTKIINHLNASCGKFETTIHSFLEVAKLKNENTKEVGSMAVAEALEKVVENLQQKIHESKATVKLEVDAKLEVNFTKESFNSVLENLIGNAIKYRAEQRKCVIDVRAYRDLTDNKVIIEVQDNGLGIDLQLNGGKVFGMFKRFHNHVEGTGLGLFMVKNQIENHGGTIRLESELNKGSKFIITLN